MEMEISPKNIQSHIYDKFLEINTFLTDNTNWSSKNRDHLSTYDFFHFKLFVLESSVYPQDLEKINNCNFILTVNFNFDSENNRLQIGDNKFIAEFEINKDNVSFTCKKNENWNSKKPNPKEIDITDTQEIDITDTKDTDIDEIKEKEIKKKEINPRIKFNPRDLKLTEDSIVLDSNGIPILGIAALNSIISIINNIFISKIEFRTEVKDETSYRIKANMINIINDEDNQQNEVFIIYKK